MRVSPPQKRRAVANRTAAETNRGKSFSWTAMPVVNDLSLTWKAYGIDLTMAIQRGIFRGGKQTK
jgi:hypothetical protein